MLCIHKWSHLYRLLSFKNIHFVDIFSIHNFWNIFHWNTSTISFKWKQIFQIIQNINELSYEHLSHGPNNIVNNRYEWNVH